MFMVNLKDSNWYVKKIHSYPDQVELGRVLDSLMFDTRYEAYKVLTKTLEIDKINFYEIEEFGGNSDS